jgi:hypothetical protein
MTRHDSNRDELSLEEVVRRALRARADRVEIAPDALDRIQTRTARRGRTFTVTLASLATAAAAVVVALVVGLNGCLPRPVTHVMPPATQMPSGEAGLPIYYTGVVGGAPVLYREFHPATPTDTGLHSGIEQAVRIMLAGQPFDPDYGSYWPAAAAVVAVTIDTSPAAGSTGKDSRVAVVDLTGAMPTGTAKATALQQLIWTVTAVAADRGVQLTGVRIRHDGVDESAAPLTRAPALDTLAPVWLISPQQGDTVGPIFDVHIAAVLDASVHLRVRDAGGTVVRDQPVTVRATAPTTATSRGEGHVTLDLPPGSYTVEAFVVAGATPRAPDNHVITVR